MSCPVTGAKSDGVSPHPDVPPPPAGRGAGQGTYYASYLRVDELLSLQCPKSNAHEEMLFIITHQAYELWFKQILYELDSVRKIFSAPRVAERDMGIAVARLARVKEIQALCIQQISILETMTPLDFLAFRDILYPASGFQSVQFRQIENALGLLPTARLSYGGARGYCSVLRPADEDKVIESERQTSLFNLLQAWLERMPFLEFDLGVTSGEGASPSPQVLESPTGSISSSSSSNVPPPTTFSFWSHYNDAVNKMLDADEAAVHEFSSSYTPASRTAHLADIASQRAHFHAVLDKDAYEASQARGERRLSHRATQAALMITLFQHEPGLQLPYRLLCALLDIDELLGAWRARHAQMVHRMLGAKIGTGGSAGYAYLKATVDKHRIFTDFFNLSTFLIPEAKLPALPRSLSVRLSFNFESQEEV